MLRLWIVTLILMAATVASLPFTTATSGDDCPGAWRDFLEGGDAPRFNNGNCSPLGGGVDLQGCLCDLRVTCDRPGPDDLPLPKPDDLMGRLVELLP